MVMGKEQEGRILTLDFDESRSIESLSKRRLIILATLIPIASIFPEKEANAVIPALIMRLFARSLFRKFATKSASRIVPRLRKVPPVIVRDPASHSRKRRARTPEMKYGDVIEIAKTVSDTVDIANNLDRTVWDSSPRIINMGSMTIDNSDASRRIETGDINIHLRDLHSNATEFSSVISSVPIPARTRLVVDMKFQNLDNIGVKKLYGSFGNGKYDAKESGEILVLENASKKLKGRSVNDLYKEYQRYKSTNSKYILG